MDPEFHELAFEGQKVSVGLWREGGFELDPVYARIRGFGLDVPNWLDCQYLLAEKRGDGHTSINFTANNESGVANSRSDNGNILCVIVDYLIFTTLDVISGCRVPSVWHEAESFKFIA